jgi:hypothetical protein
MIPKKINLDEFSDLLNVLKENPENYVNTFVIHNLNKFWHEIVGQGLVNYTSPHFYKDSGLTILISHDSYRMELLFIKDMVLKNCNKYTGDSKIKYLRFKIGNIKPRNRINQKIKKSSTDKENLLTIVEKEDDPETKRNLLKLIELL